jgi:hypothetical protein
VGVFLRGTHCRPECLHTAYLDSFRGEVEGETEVPERVHNLLQGSPRGDQAGEGHIASRAAHGLEMDVGQDARWVRPGRLALLFLATVRDLARRQQGGGEGDG